MDSRQLAYFRQTVESGSITTAARLLGIAQPSLSQQLRNLENSLGVSLFERSVRGIAPTEAGQRLFEFAVRITDEMRRAEEAMRDGASEPFGSVAFGMPASISMALSIPLAETIRLEMPEVRFRAVEAMSGHIKEWIKAGDIDLALLYDLEGVHDFSARLILHEDLWFYAAPDDWPFETPPGRPVPLISLHGLELTLPSQRHGLRTLIERIASQHAMRPHIVTEMDSLQQIKQLVSRGSGYTILSQAAVHDFVESGLIVGSPIVEPQIRRPVHLVQPVNRPMTAATRGLETLCQEVIRDLVGRGIWQAELASDPVLATVRGDGYRGAGRELVSSGGEKAFR